MKKQKNSFNIWYYRSRWFLFSRIFIKKGYYVHGVKRRSSSFNTGRIDHIYEDPHVNNRKFILHYGDVTDLCQFQQS